MGVDNWMACVLVLTSIWNNTAICKTQGYPGLNMGNGTKENHALLQVQRQDVQRSMLFVQAEQDEMECLAGHGGTRNMVWAASQQPET